MSQSLMTDTTEKKIKRLAHHTITENGNTVNCYEYAIKTEEEYKIVLSAIDKVADMTIIPKHLPYPILQPNAEITGPGEPAPGEQK